MNRPIDRPDATIAPREALKTYYAGPRKRRRGLLLIVGALAVPPAMHWLGVRFDPNSVREMAYLGLTVTALLGIAALGIGRFFDPLPTLQATRSGIVLFPLRRSPGVVPWHDIGGIEAYRIKTLWGTVRFVSFLVDDPATISAHLSPIQRIAFRIDRAWLGENRYLRTRNEFERSVAEVVAELQTFRERFS